jgi:DNA-binding response OmpR family regulator
VVEDDLTISELLAYNLRRAGYTVTQERTGRAGLDAALSGSVDLVLMDLMLPGLDGITCSREIKRHKPELPIIVLTARTERETQLSGFEVGVDDYVTKPFDMDVLLARIQARLRRPSREPALGSRPGKVGRLDLDSDAHAIRSPSASAFLKPKEHDLLQLLLTNPAHLFTREEIVERVWRHQYLPGSRSLDVHVRRLREKLEQLDSDVTIETIRGVGYRLMETVKPGDGTGGGSEVDGA